ncbi:ATP-binding protein [bacterium AH-315-J21]|nr:ATP-binding protein [bacterium AH-315-J21]
MRHRSGSRLKPTESVDATLRRVLTGFERYHSSLNSKLSTSYKTFQRSVLSEWLYNDEYDTLKNLTIQETTPEEKRSLVAAFAEVGLLGREIGQRIESHFKMMEVAKVAFWERDNEDGGLNIDHLLALPLFRRTKAMIEYALVLESTKEQIFSPLNEFIAIANSFLTGKVVSVGKTGGLEINLNTSGDQIMKMMHLSSGEKQLLILLIHALLNEGKPIVYIVDEPELSLHVNWQEKLIPSLVKLGKPIQIIAATHSPDVAGSFANKIIDLSKVSS